MSAVVAKLKIKKNDQVQVIAGREKGKTGKVLKVNTTSMTIVVEKVNMVKKHVRPSQKNPQGGIIEKELPLQYSNVQLYCPKCNKGVRIASKAAASKVKKGDAAHTAKIRACKKCGETLGSV